MTEKPENPTVGEIIKKRRAKIDSLSVYEVTDYELDNLIAGSSSLYLNFCIASLSTAISFLIALLSTKIESDRVFVIFVVLAVIGFGGGIILFVMWYTKRKTALQIVEKIRSRMLEVK